MHIYIYTHTNIYYLDGLGQLHLRFLHLDVLPAEIYKLSARACIDRFICIHRTYIDLVESMLDLYGLTCYLYGLEYVA